MGDGGGGGDPDDNGQYPNMAGHYLFADYCSGNFWSMLSDSAGGWMVTPHGNLISNPSGFGEDENGKLYVVSQDTRSLYRVRDAWPVMTVAPTITGTLTMVPPTTSSPMPMLAATPPPSNFLLLIHKPDS